MSHYDRLLRRIHRRFIVWHLIGIAVSILMILAGIILGRLSS